MTEITRYQFALNSNNSEVVKAGLVEIIAQVFEQDATARVKVLHANEFTEKPNLAPWDLPMAKHEDFVLSQLLKHSPQLEEVFMVWNTDNNDDNLLSALRTLFFVLLLGEMEKTMRRETSQKLLRLYSKAIREQLLATDPRTRATTFLLLSWITASRVHLPDSLLETVKESLSKGRTQEEDFSFANASELASLVHYKLIGIHLLVQLLDFDFNKASKVFLEDQTFLPKLLVDLSKMQAVEVSVVLQDVAELCRLYPKLYSSLPSIFSSTNLSKELFPERQDSTTAGVILQFWKDWLPRLETAKDQQKVDSLFAALITTLKPLSLESHKQMELILLERRVTLLSKSLKKLKSLNWTTLTAEDLLLRLEHMVALAVQFGPAWIEAQKKERGSSNDEEKAISQKPIVFLSATGITKPVFAALLSHTSVAVNTLACKLYGQCLKLLSLQRQQFEQNQSDRHFGEIVLDLLPDPAAVFAVWNKLSTLLKEYNNPTTTTATATATATETTTKMEVEVEVEEDIELGIEGNESEPVTKSEEPPLLRSNNTLSRQQFQAATLSSQLTEYLSSLPLLFQTPLPSTMLTGCEPLKCLETLLVYHCLSDALTEASSLEIVTVHQVLLAIELLLLVVEKRQLNWFGSLEEVGKSLLSGFTNEDWLKSYRSCRCSQLLELLVRVRSKVQQLSEKDKKLRNELIVIERGIVQVLQSLMATELRMIPITTSTDNSNKTSHPGVLAELESLVWIRACQDNQRRGLLLDLTLRLIKHFQVEITWYYLQLTDQPPPQPASLYYTQFMTSCSLITQTLLLLYNGHFTPFLSLFAQYMQKYLQNPGAAAGGGGDMTGRQGFLRHYLTGLRKEIEEMLSVGLPELVILSQEPWKTVEIIEKVVRELPNYLGFTEDSHSNSNKGGAGVEGLIASLPRYNEQFVAVFTAVTTTPPSQLSTKELKKLLKNSNSHTLLASSTASASEVSSPGSTLMIIAGIQQLVDRILSFDSPPNHHQAVDHHHWEVAVQSLTNRIQTLVTASTLTNRINHIPLDLSLVILQYLALFHLLLLTHNALQKEESRSVLTASDRLCRYYLDHLSLVLPTTATHGLYLLHQGFVQSSLWATNPFGMVCRKVVAKIISQLEIISADQLLAALPKIAPDLVKEQQQQVVLLRNDSSFLKLIEELIVRLASSSAQESDKNDENTVNTAIIASLRPLLLYYLDYRLETLEQLLSPPSEEETEEKDTDSNRADPLTYLWLLLSPSDGREYLTKLLQQYLPVVLHQVVVTTEERLDGGERLLRFLQLLEPPPLKKRHSQPYYYYRDVKYLLLSSTATATTTTSKIVLPNLTLSALLKIPLPTRIIFLQGVLRLLCDSPLHPLLYPSQVAEKQKIWWSRDLVSEAIETHLQTVNTNYGNNNDWLASYRQVLESLVVTTDPFVVEVLVEDLVWRDGARCLYSTLLLDLANHNHHHDDDYWRLVWEVYVQSSMAILSTDSSTMTATTASLEEEEEQQVLSVERIVTLLFQSVDHSSRQLLPSSVFPTTLVDQWLKVILKRHLTSARIMKCVQQFLQLLHQSHCYQVDLTNTALHPLQCLRFLVTHSKIAVVLSTHSSSSASVAVVVLTIIFDLLTVIIATPYQTISEKEGTLWKKVLDRIEELLAETYQGSMSAVDLLIIRIYSLLAVGHRHNRIQSDSNLVSYYYYLPNPLPVTTTPTIIATVPIIVFQRLIEYFKVERIHHTINHYPIFRRLLSAPSTATSTVNEKEEEADSSALSYDPLLVIPLIASIIETIVAQLPPPPLAASTVEEEETAEGEHQRYGQVHNKKRKRSSSDDASEELSAKSRATAAVDEAGVMSHSYVIPYLRRFIHQGGLALLIATLSSTCEQLRLLALASLQRLYHYLQTTRDSDSADLNYRDRAAILTLLSLLRQSLQPAPTATATITESVMTEKTAVAWLPVTLSQFLSRASLILMNFHHPLQAIVSKLLVKKPVLKAESDLPLFEEVLFAQHALTFPTTTSNTTNDNSNNNSNSQASQTLYAKLFVLRLLRDSLRTSYEHEVLVRRNVYQRLLLVSTGYYYQDAPKLLLVVVEILDRAMLQLVEIDEGGRGESCCCWQGWQYLWRKCQVLSWLSSLVRQIMEEIMTTNPNPAVAVMMALRGSLLVAVVALLRRILQAVQWLQQQSPLSAAAEEGEEAIEKYFKPHELSQLFQSYHLTIASLLTGLSRSLTVSLAAEEVMRSQLFYEIVLLATDYVRIGSQLAVTISESMVAMIQWLSSFLMSWKAVMGPENQKELQPGYYFTVLRLGEMLDCGYFVRGQKNQKKNQKNDYYHYWSEEVLTNLSEIVEYCQQELINATSIIITNSITITRPHPVKGYNDNSSNSSKKKTWRETLATLEDQKAAMITQCQSFPPLSSSSSSSSDSLKALLRSCLLVQVVVLSASSHHHHRINLTLTAQTLRQYHLLFTKDSNSNAVEEEDSWWQLPVEVIIAVCKVDNNTSMPLSKTLKESLNQYLSEEEGRIPRYDFYQEMLDGFLIAIAER